MTDMELIIHTIGVILSSIVIFFTVTLLALTGNLLLLLVATLILVYSLVNIKKWFDYIVNK